MFEKIRNVVDSRDSLEGRVFDVFIQVLVILSVVIFTIQTEPGLSSETNANLRTVSLIIVIIFTIEYLVRLIIARQKAKFVFSFFGIIDLLAILPFYLSLGIDIRGIRVFRLFRLLRIFKLFRYGKALDRIKRAGRIARQELILFFLFTLFILYLAGVGIYYFENEVQPEKFRSIIDSIWWGIATLTTVGYGDVYPITAGGKIFTFVILMLGLGIVSLPAGIVSSAMQKAREEEAQESD